MNNLPEVCMDDEGYPTEEYLTYLRTFEGQIPILELLDIIFDNWYHGSYGYRKGRLYKGKRKIELHTLGWSGNEDVINAITNNIFLTHICMKYVMWKKGGHYYFTTNV